MTEKEQKTNSWHLIHNNNGEWISDEHAVFLDKFSAFMYIRKAVLHDMKLSKQTFQDGSIWFYKHEIKELKAVIDQQVNKPRRLKIPKYKMSPEIIKKLNSTFKHMEKKQEIYYDREMTASIESLLRGKFSWFIPYVREHKELDFQTGKNWFSIYKGTGRILTLKPNGTISAASKYKELNPEFYEFPTKEGLDTLLEKIKKTETLSRYYIGTDGKKREGYYQTLIARRYTLSCKPDDEFIIIDKEFVIGYKDNETKGEWLFDPKKWVESKIKSAKEAGIPGKIKNPGTECDFVGITKEGDLLLMELKRYEDSSSIYRSPLQIGYYDELTHNLMEKYKEEMTTSVIKMLHQKIKLRLIDPAWGTLPCKLSGKIRLAVVVGGEASKVAKERFSKMKQVVGKEIAYYTCNETNGTLIQETW